MSAPAQENWANARLSVTIERRYGGGCRVDWRLSVKPPSASWDVRSTVAHGSENLAGVTYPPSRDEVLAAMVEVLMGIRWTE